MPLRSPARRRLPAGVLALALARGLALTPTSRLSADALQRGLGDGAADVPPLELFAASSSGHSSNAGAALAGEAAVADGSFSGEYAQDLVDDGSDTAGSLARAAAEAHQRFVDAYPTVLDDNLRSSPAEQMPRLMRLFDWVVGLPHCQDPRLAPMFMRELPRCWPSEVDHTRALGPTDPYSNQIDDPRTVMVDVLRIGDLLEYASKHFDTSRTDRVLYVVSDLNITTIANAFDDTVPEVMARLQRFFSTVWMAATDVHAPGLRTMPSPLRDFYLRDGTVEVASKAIEEASLAGGRKKRSVLAAWGGPGLEPDCGGEGHRDNRFACESRAAAASWADSPVARALGVELARASPAEYWRKLGESRFLLSPLGQGIQSPKVVEALLALTIPIVQRGGFPAYDELVEMGFPIVVVDDWSEITAASVSAWWRDMSPRLEPFRRNCLTTDAYWKLITGVVQRCE